MDLRERYNEWLKRASEVARELNLEIEFRTKLYGQGYMSYEGPVVEITDANTYRFEEIEGALYIPCLESQT